MLLTYTLRPTDSNLAAAIVTDTLSAEAGTDLAIRSSVLVFSCTFSEWPQLAVYSSFVCGIGTDK